MENKLKYEGEEYDVSDVDDNERYWLAQVRSLRERIAKARFDLDQLVAAERAFSNTLIKSLQKEETDDNIARLNE